MRLEITFKVYDKFFTVNFTCKNVLDWRTSSGRRNPVRWITGEAPAKY